MREQYLIHWRTKGSKNGERRYQYEDGTYTPLGKARRRVGGFLDDVDTIFSKRNFREDADYDNMRSKDARYGKGSSQKVEDKYKNDYYESKLKRQETEDGPSQSDQQNEKQEKRQEQPKQQAQPKQQEKKGQKKSQTNTLFTDTSKAVSSFQKISNIKKHNEKVDRRNAEIAAMSDEELTKIWKRLNLEKNYKEALNYHAKEKSKIEVADIIDAVGNVIVVAKDLREFLNG